MTLVIRREELYSPIASSISLSIFSGKYPSKSLCLLIPLMFILSKESSSKIFLKKSSRMGFDLIYPGFLHFSRAFSKLKPSTHFFLNYSLNAFSLRSEKWNGYSWRSMKYKVTPAAQISTS